MLVRCLQVAFMNDGSFLVSDGYCNSRVLRNKPDGAFVAQYELPKEAGGGNGRGGSGMGVAHSLVVDECDGEVDVADREFGRVHRFDLQTRELISELLVGWGWLGGCWWGMLWIWRIPLPKNAASATACWRAFLNEELICQHSAAFLLPPDTCLITAIVTLC
jgi:hypothetical protein